MVKDVKVSVPTNTGTYDCYMMDFYNNWAQNYDQDQRLLEYRPPTLAANSIASHFHGDRGAAAILDVACATGLVAIQMKSHGFRHFVGVDGSRPMLEKAKHTGLYQDLKKCVLGTEPLPVDWGSFDVVVIVGALSYGDSPVSVVRDLCRAARPGGFVWMTTKASQDNMEYKAALERELRLMEEEGLWSAVEVSEELEWVRSEHEEEGFIPGRAYKKTSPLQ